MSDAMPPWETNSQEPEVVDIVDRRGDAFDLSDGQDGDTLPFERQFGFSGKFKFTLN